jgi:hypothetical protein
MALVAIGALVLPRDRAEAQMINCDLATYVGTMPAHGFIKAGCGKLLSPNGQYVLEVVKCNGSPKKQLLLKQGGTMKWQVLNITCEDGALFDMRGDGLAAFTSSNGTLVQGFPRTAAERVSGSTLRLEDNGNLTVRESNGNRTWGVSANPNLNISLLGINLITGGSCGTRNLILGVPVRAQVKNLGNLTIYNSVVEFRKTAGGPLVATRNVRPAGEVPPGETRDTGKSENYVTLYTESELINMGKNCSGTTTVSMHLTLKAKSMFTWASITPKIYSSTRCVRIQCLNTGCPSNCSGCVPPFPCQSGGCCL